MTEVATDVQAQWDQKVEKILKNVRGKASLFMWLGYGVYGLGSIAIMYFMRDQPGLATAVVMFFFQLCVIYFGTRQIFPCIAGGFWLGIEANRDSVPAFSELAKISKDLAGRFSVWERIGTKVEEDLIPRFNKAVERAEHAADQAEKTAKLVEEKAAPIIESAARIESAVEKEIDTGLFTDVREAAIAAKSMVIPPAPGHVPVGGGSHPLNTKAVPDIGKTLASIGGSNGLRTLPARGGK